MAQITKMSKEDKIHYRPELHRNIGPWIPWQHSEESTSIQGDTNGNEAEHLSAEHGLGRSLSDNSRSSTWLSLNDRPEHIEPLVKPIEIR